MHTNIHANTVVHSHMLFARAFSMSKSGTKHQNVAWFSSNFRAAHIHTHIDHRLYHACIMNFVKEFDPVVNVYDYITVEEIAFSQDYS